MARSSLIPSRSGLPGSGSVGPLLSLHREIDRMFDDVFRGIGFPAWGGGDGGPSREMANFVNADMNVSETDGELRITAELPGVKEEDIEISLDDDVLTVSGEKKVEQTKGGEKENYHFMERSYGRFRRSVRIPFHADPDQVQARFENGVLTITVPKPPQSRQSTRRIRIQGSAGGSGGPAGAQGGGTQSGGGSAGQNG